jgi:ABC-type dipeptide/oligopeptide/nickel transport system permease subunit
MLADAQQGIFQSSTGVIPPAAAIVVLVVSISVLADRLADRSERR